MTEDETPKDASDSPESEARTLLERVAAAIGEIEQAKRERSADEVRAARIHLAALHGVAQLRRRAERQGKAA
jgi:hypothetical protein